MWLGLNRLQQFANDWVAQMGKNWRVLLCAVVASAALMVAQPVAAEGGYEDTTVPSAAAMGFDVLVVRPLSLAATVIGTGLFVASLPFSLLGWNVDKAAMQLVAEPAAYTFLRPLGEFETGRRTP